MSLKDMCLIRHLEEIKKSGVASLKIEGRMKGPDYVSTVVSMYRKYLDTDNKITTDDYHTLESIFFRGGFSDGYFTDQKGRDMFCHNKPDNPYLKQKEVLYNRSNYKKTKLFLYLNAQVGKKLHLNAIDEYGNTAEFYSADILHEANNITLSEDNIKEKLNKLGDTVFVLDTLETNFDKNVYVPASVLNEARRNVTRELSDKIVESSRRNGVSNYHEVKNKKRSDGFFEGFSIGVSTKEQLKAVLNTNCKKIYAPLELKNYCKGDEIIMLPRITPANIEEELKNLNNTDVLITNIGQLLLAKKFNKNIHIDFTMNVFNTHSCNFYSQVGSKSITLSTELTLRQIADITPYCDCEAIVYGKLPLMITENCLINSSERCTKGGYIYDRTNESFMIKCLPDCRNEIYNSKPVMMSDKYEDIINSGLKYGRLNFTDESPQECLEIYEMYKKHNKLDIEFTRGKFYKGV